MDSEPQEKPRGIILVPLQCIGVPSAISSLTPLEDLEAGPGKTETEAPELTRKSLSDKISGTKEMSSKLLVWQERRLEWKCEWNRQVGQDCPPASQLGF